MTYALGANVENLVLLGFDAIDGTGNELANRIEGNAGHNSIDGGAGADTMSGAGGDDTYFADDFEDTVIEAFGEGIDSVFSSVTFELGENVENLTLTGSSVINAIGNAQNNVLIGNVAANILDSWGGSDTLIGGLGDDTYVVDDAGDVVSEAAAEGSDTVVSSIGYALGANIENLYLSGTAAIDGAGNELNNVLVGNEGRCPVAC
jgi:Ca2+-binding RTX toxin-like protein